MDYDIKNYLMTLKLTYYIAVLFHTLFSRYFLKFLADPPKKKFSRIHQLTWHCRRTRACLPTSWWTSHPAGFGIGSRRTGIVGSAWEFRTLSAVFRSLWDRRPSCLWTRCRPSSGPSETFPDMAPFLVQRLPRTENTENLFSRFVSQQHSVFTSS